VQLPSLKDVSKIGAGAYLSMALMKDGTVWTLGGNIFSQLGVGIKPDNLPASADPAQVVISQPATAITSGFAFALARAGSNTWGWGENSMGQLGIGFLSGNPQDNNSGTINPTRGAIDLWPKAAPTIQRIAGIQAINTAVEIAKKGWPNGSSTVILATVNNFPDALSAATLAHQFDAPILLTDKKSLDPDVQTEIDKLNPSKIIIVGGTAVVSGDIENSLKQKYNDVTRLAGFDQYETNAKIADYFFAVNPNAPKKVVIANGDNYPDALSISSWAAYNHMPILLTKSKELPTVTSSVLVEHYIDDAILVGGRAAISDDVAKDITSIVSIHWDGSDPNRSLVRYWGMDQYETSIAIARGLRANTSIITVATGENFPDALAGSALAARTGSPIILVDKNMSKASVSNFLSDNSGQMRQVYLLGGKAVITDSSYASVSNYLAE
ncbi:MAG: cell wall-binding repeat-containing protein, partial [Ignavibacteriales bacterium]